MKTRILAALAAVTFATTALAYQVTGEVDPSLLPPGGGTEREPGEEPAMTLKARVDAFERGLVVEALRAAGGNRTEAARRLGISRVTLHDKLHKHGLARGGDEQ